MIINVDTAHAEQVIEILKLNGFKIIYISTESTVKRYYINVISPATKSITMTKLVDIKKEVLTDHEIQTGRKSILLGLILLVILLITLLILCITLKN